MIDVVGLFFCSLGFTAAATCLCVWHSVPERATYGTEHACRAQKGFLGYATHFRRHSVPKTGSWGTRRIFKGPQNSRLHRLWTAPCRTGRIFSARNGRIPKVETKKPAEKQRA